MIARRQLAVASPLSAVGLLRATGAVVRPPRDAHPDVARTLAHRFSATAVALTDSGTAALTLALRLVVGEGRTVAFPAYVCVDLIAAAKRANVRVRLYDVDPRTLSPDLDSVHRVLAEGVDAITVVHLYGLPADVDAIRELSEPYGIPVIEDAAQHAGAMLRDRRAGALGDVSILSFGRGKGTTSGNGGALLTHDARWVDAVRASAPDTSMPIGRGTRDVIGATASWLLGRPSVYDIPSSIPSLHLGETVYHDASEPAPMSYAAAALLRTSLASADAHRALRQQHADLLRRTLDAAHTAGRAAHLRACTPVEGGVAGYLRFPVVTAETTRPAPLLGIVRGYPRPLSEQPELRPLLLPSRETHPGAHELARRLMTLPTHHLVSARDLDALNTWLRTA